MGQAVVESDVGVTLVGAGEVDPATLAAALARAPRLVAADGGADRALAAGHMPEAAIGDMDSLSAEGRAALGAARLHRIAEQETTDFDKVLRSVAAPFLLAVGFTGARLDHTLGAFDALARHPGRRAVLMGREDAVFLMPPRLELRLAPGTRLSLYPLGPVEGDSEGLHWPIGGLGFAPGGMTGLSNRTSAAAVRLQVTAPRMLAILPAGALDAVLAGLAAAPGWG